MIKEFKNFSDACKYKELIAKKLGEEYNVSVEEVEEGIWLVRMERGVGIGDLIKDTGKTFVKSISGGVSLCDLSKKTEKESFSEVFEDTGKNFVKGLSGLRKKESRK